MPSFFLPGLIIYLLMYLYRLYACLATLLHGEVHACHIVIALVIAFFRNIRAQGFRRITSLFISRFQARRNRS